MLFAAVTTGLFFGGVELGLAVVGVAPAIEREDPFLGFEGSAPLFVRSTSDRGVFETAPAKRRYFNAQRFASPKPAGTTRIFCLGGSSVHGHPYDHATSFCGWLAELLPVADPSRQWEVINAGGISYASYRVARVMEELATHEPDLFIVYTAHNEFLEERTVPDATRSGGVVVALESRLMHTRTYSLLARSLRGAAEGPPRETLPAEVATRLDGATGLDAFTRDDALRERVQDHYRANLRRMAAIARDADAKLMLATPASNLAGMSPFKSEPSVALSPYDAERFERAVAVARDAAQAGRIDAALAACRGAALIDGRRADLHYRCAGLMRRQGEPEAAKAAYLRAIEEDVCPLRALPGMRDDVLAVARDADAAVVDFGELAERLSPDGIPDASLFLDHVHPGIELHRAFALAIVKTMAAEGWLAPSSGWNAQAIDRVAKRVHAGIDAREHGIALRNLAVVLGYTGKTVESDRVARRAAAKLPDDATAQYLAGLADARAGDLRGAVRRLGVAARLEPRDPETHHALALVRLQQGRLPDAERSARRVLALAPEHARARETLGRIALERRQPERAKQWFAEALEHDPRLASSAATLAALESGQSATVVAAGTAR